MSYYLSYKILMLFIINSQRDTIQAVSNFAQRNQLPTPLQHQVHEHLYLKFRIDSEWLQQETLDSLPKAIKSKISHHLFCSVLDSVYLFHGVSNDLCIQLVIAKFCF